MKQTYYITYKNEFETFVEASSTSEALEKATNSENWRFIVEGHPEFFEVYDKDGFEVSKINL